VPFAAGLYYEERGSGPPLLLSHGVIESSRSLRALAEGLAGRFRTIAYDGRGRGRSPRGPVDPRRLADDVAALACALELGRFHHAGHSLGGRVALEHAAAHPDQVAAIAVISARAEAPDERGRERLRRLIARVRREGAGAAADLWIERADPLHAEVSAISAANGLAGTIAALERLLRMESFVDRLADVRTPALIMVGDRDEAYLPSALLMAKRLPLAELAVLPGVGHFPNLEATDLVAERLVRFLAAQH
jgi:pimeloyl-ACP methyl ester carboxylesterase